MKNGPRRPIVYRTAVSLTAGFLALLACYMLISRTSQLHTDVYATFAEEPGTRFITIPESVPNGTIDPNTATAEELMTIPGIGPKTAEAIIAEREANGPFLYPEDLMAVSGIGEKKLEAFRPYLYFQN